MLYLDNPEEGGVGLFQVLVHGNHAVTIGPPGTEAADSPGRIEAGRHGLFRLFGRADHRYDDAVHAHLEDGLDDDGIVAGHPHESCGSGPVGRHDVGQKPLLVEGAVLRVYPEEVVAETGHGLGDRGIGEEDVAPYGEPAAREGFRKNMRFIHRFAPLHRCGQACIPVLQV